MERIRSRGSGFGFLSFRVLKSPGGRSHAGSGMVTTPKRRKYNSRHWETLRDPRKRILIYKSTQPHVFGLNWPIKLSDGPLSGALCQQARSAFRSSTPPPQFDIAWLVGARGAKDAEITSRLAKHATSTFQTKWKTNSYFAFQQVLRCALHSSYYAIIFENVKGDHTKHLGEVWRSREWNDIGTRGNFSLRFLR